MWILFRSPKINGSMRGFQRRVLCPKCTPASSIWRIVKVGRAISKNSCSPVKPPWGEMKGRSPHRMALFLEFARSCRPSCVNWIGVYPCVWRNASQKPQKPRRQHPGQLPSHLPSLPRAPLLLTFGPATNQSSCTSRTPGTRRKLCRKSPLSL